MRRSIAAVLLVALLASAGCLGTGTKRMCVDSVQSGGGQATIRGDGATFTYSDPQGLVSSNWQERGIYAITYENNLFTQTLKGFTREGACPVLG